MGADVSSLKRAKIRNDAKAVRMVDELADHHQ